MILSTYFNLNNVINFFVNDTNNCVDCLRSEGCRTWADDENLPTIIFSCSPGLSSVLESSAETSSMPQ